MNTACMSSKLVTHSSINAAAADETNDLIGYFFPAMRQLPQQSTPQHFELLSAGAAIQMLAHHDVGANFQEGSGPPAPTLWIRA